MARPPTDLETDVDRDGGALIEHTAVSKPAVVGISDEERDEVVKAFLVLGEGHTPGTCWWTISARSSGSGSRTGEVHRSISIAPQPPNDIPDGQPTRAS